MSGVAQLLPDLSIHATNAVQSVVLLAALLVLVGGVYRSGSWLKGYFGDETAEAVQSVVATAFGVAAAAVLVSVWRLDDEVLLALESVVPGAQTSVKAMVSVLVLAVAYTVTRVTKRAIGVGQGRNHISRHQEEILHHVVQILVFVPAVLFTFALWELNPSSVLLGAGALGIVVGLAARQTLGAVLAGFVLLFSRPFRVGDWVVIDEEEGVVRDVSIVNTRIRTFDNEEVMIPNDEITASNIVNRSRNDLLRVRTEVGVDYDADPVQAADVAREAMEGLDPLTDSRNPDVVHERFGDSAVVLELRYWIENPTIHRKWRAQNAVVDAVKSAFEREGISIPFPQRELSGRPPEGFRVDGVSDAAGTAVESGVESDGEDANGSSDADGEESGANDGEEETEGEDAEAAVDRAEDGR